MAAAIRGASLRTRGDPVVNVLHLGRMGFLLALDIQLRYARQHLRELAGRPGAVGRDVLLLVEHNPVYTIGLRGSRAVSQDEEQRLRKLGAEFYRCKRGGLLTYHGPGQLVAYPVLNLRHFELSPKDYVSALHASLLNTCRRLGVRAATCGQPGISVDNQQIAAVGVHLSGDVTTQGMALNCDTDLSWFQHIRPCGMEGTCVSSISEQLRTQTPIHKAVAPLLEAFGEEFRCHMELSLLDNEDVSVIRGEGVEKKVIRNRAGNAMAGKSY